MFEFGEFRVDPRNRTLRRRDELVPLSRRAFEVLLYLVQNPGRAVTKEELLKSVWQDAFVDENNLTQSISALRRALEEKAGAKTYIATLPGRGYQFVLPVDVIEGAAGLSVTPGQSAGQGAVVVHQRTVTTSTVTEGHDGKRDGWRWLATGCAVLAVAVAAGYATWVHLHPRPSSATVVVAEFLNTTGDATFDNTLHRALEIDLGQSPYMDVMSERAVVGELQLMGKPGDSALNAELARQVCERDNRQAVLAGSIAGMGSKYLLTLEATNCATGEELASAKAEARSKEEVLAALDKVADKVRSKLGESAKSMASYEVPIAQVTTPSLEALKAFSVGRYMDAQGASLTDALRSYQQAVELDPQFAVAYGEIATHYYNLNEYRLASQYYKKAFDLSDRVGPKERLTIQAHYYAQGLGDRLEGIKAYQVWAATYPREWIPWLNISNEYTQLGEYGPAIEAGQQAVQRAQNRQTYIVLARAYKRAGRFVEALATAADAQNHGKDSDSLHALLYEIAVAEHDSDALARETAWGNAHPGWYFLDYEANAAATDGQYSRAVSFFDQSYAAAMRDGLTESADNVLEDQVTVELEFGLNSAARATLARVTAASRGSAEEAILHAEAGDTALAEAFLAEHSKDGTSDTDMTYILLPRLRAVIAMDHGKPLAAVAALEASKPYDLASYDILTLRGEAYLKAGQAGAAAAQYRKILDNPGIDGITPLYLLAHLGMARAYAQAGDTNNARNEYAALLTAWKDADQSLPVLVAAKAALSSH